MYEKIMKKMIKSKSKRLFIYNLGSSYNYKVLKVCDIFLKEIKIKDNFELADQFYNIHIIANYVLIGLVALHVSAVIIHKLFFKENLLKKIL